MKIPDSPPNVKNLIEEFETTDPGLLLSLLNNASPLDNKGNYRHWDKLKYLELPEKIDNHRLWWTLIKISRNNNYKTLPIKGLDSINFKYNIIDDFQKSLHFLDQYASGNISLDAPILNQQLKNTYLVSSLIEESITSSQLEGATTTRDVAKKMIREGRQPKDRSEKMILNNYKAIRFIKTIKNEKLTPEIIDEIHKIISENTLDKPGKAGVYRDENDDIHVLVDNDKVVFTPPKYTEIANSIQDLCKFANNDNFTDYFIHPVIKAIFIHFYLAYMHPYIDGNGRTARALFYWYMLKKGYWLTEYISISRILKQAPAKYGLSFLYTETDENDFTYFIDYQLAVIKRAVDDFNGYLRNKMKEIANTEDLLKNTKLANQLNLRQLTLLRNAIKSPGKIYNIAEHKTSHDIAYETARRDLLVLAENYNLLVKVKEKNSFVFIVPSDIKDRIKSST
jgi:Fic family protein